MLGERYGIPTEFTSYLVTEPQLAMNRQVDMRRDASRLAGAAVGAVMNAPAPTAPRAAEMRFESARAASAQRAASSIAALDSISLAKTSVDAKKDASASTRMVNGHTFVLRDGTWTDSRFTNSLAVTKIKPFSKAYFDLVAALPELRASLALGDRVIVVGRERAISTSDDGVSELSPSLLAAIVKAW